MMLHTKYQDSRHYGIRQEDVFHTFPLLAYEKNVNPGAGHTHSFLAWGHNLNNLCRGLLGHATYHISRLYALRFQTRRFFHVFPM